MGKGKGVQPVSERSIKHIWHKDTPFSLSLDSPTPPGWYLYLVIFFQIITVLVDPLIYDGHPQAMFLAKIMAKVALLWFGLNLAMFWLLYSHKAQKTAYILPGYYLTLFFVLIGLGVLLSPTEFAKSTVMMTNLQYWILIVTTIVESSIALIQLRMRSVHARRT